MKNLTDNIKKVYEATTIEGKKLASIELIKESHARDETKRKALVTINNMKSKDRVDIFMTNYMLSGEGMKVK
jgi:hypothetical protein